MILSPYCESELTLETIKLNLVDVKCMSSALAFLAIAVFIRFTDLPSFTTVKCGENNELAGSLSNLKTKKRIKLGINS